MIFKKIHLLFQMSVQTKNTVKKNLLQQDGLVSQQIYSQTDKPHTHKPRLIMSISMLSGRHGHRFALLTVNYWHSFRSEDDTCRRSQHIFTPAATMTLKIPYHHLVRKKVPLHKSWQTKRIRHAILLFSDHSGCFIAFFFIGTLLWLFETIIRGVNVVNVIPDYENVLAHKRKHVWICSMYVWISSSQVHLSNKTQILKSGATTAQMEKNASQV